MKIKRLSPRNQVRKAATRAAIEIHDKAQAGEPISAMEMALARAVDRKLDHDPGFGWQEEAR